MKMILVSMRLARMALFFVLLQAGVPTRAWAQGAGFAGPIPAGYDELVNRVFLRFAPNGAPQAFRILAGGVYDQPTPGAHRTNRVAYTRDGLPATDARLTFTATDVFSGKLNGQTNVFTLHFTNSAAGLYDLEFTTTGVTGVQKFSGPFEISPTNNIAPIFVVHPASANVPPGLDLRLSSLATGYQISYQWYRDGVAIAGATNAAYQTGPLDASRTGEYTVVASNPLGSVASRAAQVALVTVPAITVQPPPSVEAYEGATVRLTASATGGDLRYEWLLNGQQAPQADYTVPTLEITRIQPTQSGTYVLRVSNQAGSVLSNPVQVTVCTPGLDATWQGRAWVRILGSGDPVPGTGKTFGPLAAPFQPLFTVRDQTVHLVARGDDNIPRNPVVQRGLFRWRDGTLQTLVYTNTPRPGGGFFDDVFYPTDEGAGVVNFASGFMYSLAGGAVTELLGAAVPAPGRAPMVMLGSGSYARRGGAVAISSTIGTREPFTVGGYGIYLHDGTTLSRVADDTTDLPGVMTGYSGRPTEDAINFDGETIVFSTLDPASRTAGVYKATRGGVVTKLADTGDLFPGSTNRYAGFGDVDVEGGWVFAVANDGVGRPNRVIAFDEGGVGRVIANGDYLVAGGPRQVWFGGNSSIQRWTDGLLEPVATTASILDCRSVSGFFDVEAHGEDVAIGVSFRDGGQAVYFNIGRPTTGAPRILVPPLAVSTPVTTPATFAVTATGGAPLRYQWRRDGVAIAGATGAVLSLTTTTEADAGTYDVVVSNDAGSATSAGAELNLTVAPANLVVEIQPEAVSVPVGSAASLSVAVSGARPVTYQWRKAQAPIAGATGPRLDFAAVTAADHGTYDVVMANATGSITSRVTSVSVLPLITSPPVAVTVAAGGTATFSVGATGFDAYRYFWFRDGVFITGATNATLVLTGVTPASAGAYSVNVSGVGGGAVRSASVHLVVTGDNPPPGEIVLGTPVAEAGQLRFSVPTVAGRTYDIEFRTGLGEERWSTLRTLTGDGTAQVVTVPTSGAAGFVRVASRP